MKTHRLWGMLLAVSLLTGCGEVTRGLESSTASISDMPSFATESSDATAQLTTTTESGSSATSSTMSTTAVAGGSRTTKTTAATSQSTVTTSSTAATTTAPVAPSYRVGYGLGNGSHLQGKPTLAVLFVEDTESSWDATLMQHFQNVQIAKAVTFLEEQAAKRGVSLDITTKYYHGTLVGGGRVYYPDAIAHAVDERDYDLLETVVANMNEGVGDEFLAKLMKENGGQDVVFLFMVNKDGLSYARHHIRPDSQMVEYAVAYARHTDVPATDTLHKKTHNRASVIAHELLHLFGAEDLYGQPEREKLALAQYEKDIMLWTESFINRNNVGDFTAYCVGWTDTVPAVCEDENWWR